MKNKFQLLFTLLTIIFVSFPSICFSESVTVTREYCDQYLGDVKNKKELDVFRQSVKTESIRRSIYENTDIFTEKCSPYIIDNYLEKIVVVSHTKKGREICYNVKTTYDPKVISKYISMNDCKSINPFDVYFNKIPWIVWDIDEVLKNKSDKINIGVIIEIKIPDLDTYKREQLENEQEKQFFYMIDNNKDKYKVVDRRHLGKVLEEQKLSSSGLTESDSVKLGKLLNLDVIVLRLIYKNSNVTKVLKVDTGEVLLFKTYETEKKEQGWVYCGKSEAFDVYYNDSSQTNLGNNVIRVWSLEKYSKIGKDKIVKTRINNNLSIDGWDKLNYGIILGELDCFNNTRKEFKYVLYNDKGKILSDSDFQNPEILHILPGSISETLQKKVCPK